MHSSHNNQQIDPATGQPKKEGLMDKIKDAVTGHKDNTTHDSTTHGTHGHHDATHPTTGYSDQGVSHGTGHHSSSTNPLSPSTHDNTYGNTGNTQPGYATAGVQQQQGYGTGATGGAYGQDSHTSHNPLTGGHHAQQTGDYNSGIGSNTGNYQQTQGTGIGHSAGTGYGQDSYGSNTNAGYGSSHSGATHGGAMAGMTGTHGAHSTQEHGHNNQTQHKVGMMDKVAGKIQETTAKNPEDKQEGHIRATQGKEAAQQFDQQHGQGAYGSQQTGYGNQQTGYGNQQTGYGNTGTQNY